jgi:hypothetical protein
MVKHVVMWRYRDKKDIDTAREQLKSLRNRVPSMLNIEVGVNIQEGPSSYDLVLITEHENRETLQAYQHDPIHVEVKRVLGKLESDRVVVDFEI